jgi:transcriptional regulator with XRE-family HTH domain
MAIAQQHRTVEEWELLLGEQVRALRVRSGRDQAELADAAGVSLGAVKNLEQGRGSTLKTLVRIARTLDRADWLTALAPPVAVSPIELMRSGRRTPRERVYRPRKAQA